jgi:hypothetical protein
VLESLCVLPIQFDLRLEARINFIGMRCVHAASKKSVAKLISLWCLNPASSEHLGSVAQISQL